MSKIPGLGLSVEKPGRLYLINPRTRQPIVDKAGNKAYVDVFSTDSAIARAHSRAALDRAIERRGRSIPTIEQQEAERVDFLAALTAGWSLVSIETGEPIDYAFTPENARALYGEPETFWIRDQVDAFAADRGNF